MNIAVAGYGIEGKANVAYWRALGDQVTVLDEREVLADIPDGVNVLSGQGVFDDLSEYDMVIRTASLRPDKLSSARKIWSATNEFFVKCPAPIIGVTGTKGKGTTASLIASMLRAAGKTAHLVGNIGVAALDVLPTITPEDVVVFEMSSFQLWDLEKSPHVAVVLMIEPDHLDVHATLEEYVGAKSRIAATQVPIDIVVYHPTNELSERVATPGHGRKVRYGTIEDRGVYVTSNTFFVQGQQICGTDIMQIPGAHNLENACAAMTAVLAYDETISFDEISAGLKGFTGLPHRLKFIREVNGVRYYDDNYSSAPGAAIAAMRSFEQPEILILGGYDKGIQFTDLANAIKEQANIKRIILIGTTKEKIASALDIVGKADIYELSRETVLEPIVQRAYKLAESGDVVIMSPACASFDMFKNFSDRGDQFIKLVEGL